MRWVYRVPLIILGVVTILLVVITVMSWVKGIRLNTQFETHEVSDYIVLEVEGLNMAYREYGAIDNPVIVLVHGFLGSSYDYRYLSEALADDYYVIAIDLIGFGGSDKPADFDYSRESHATMIHAFLQEKDIDRYILGGHSMGGAITLYYAHLFPENVEAIMLFASAGLSENSPNALPRLFYALIFKNYYLQRLGFSSVHYQKEYQTAAYFDPMFYFTRQIPSKTLQAFSLSSDTIRINDFIDDIEIPALIIFGKEDSWIPYQVGEMLDERLSSSTLVLLEDTGHIPFIESTEDTLEAVLAFLEMIELISED